MRRIKVPRRVYAWLYGIALQLLKRAYPDCKTVLHAASEGYYNIHNTSWRAEEYRIVGELEALK